MEQMIIIISLLFFHWIADFIVQTRYQAENKNESEEALFIHCVTYSLVLTMGLFISVIIIKGIILTAIQLSLFYMSIYILHFITDFITSRVTTYYYKTGKMKKFWVVIGFDQWLHVVQILFIYLTFIV